MNAEVIKRLIIKDWDLLKKIIAAYIAGGILGLAILGYPHVYAFYLGAILLLTLLISIGCHTIISTVIMEKKEQTLPFIMTLPVSPLDYYTAKLLANLCIILLPWALLVSCVALLVFSSHIPNGLFPFLLLVCTFLLVNYAVVLCVAMLSESEGWTIIAMVLTNMLLNPFIMWISRNPEMNQYFESPEMHWTGFVSSVLIVQLLVAAAVVGLAMIRLARKQYFI